MGNTCPKCKCPSCPKCYGTPSASEPPLKPSFETAPPNYGNSSTQYVHPLATLKGYGYPTTTNTLLN